MQGQPIPFIELIEQQNGQSLETSFEVHPQAIKLLQSLQNKKVCYLQQIKVAILTIAGPQRTGKSFLANRILKRQKGFAIGPTTQPCTKGIWLWSQPINLSDNTALLIMDTEGLNSVQRDINVDTKIFSISLLLSSMFVYNQLGHIDERSIENLSLVVKLSESISVSNDASDKQLSQFFPNFLWVLRDFSLDLKGRTSQEYLEYALSMHPGQGPEVERKNQIRQKLKEYFKNRDCICMERPIDEEKRLANIEDEDWNALKPGFIHAVQDFERKVIHQIKPKQIGNTVLTADMFLKITLEYVDTINNGGIPQILTSLDRVILQEVRNIVEELKSQYVKKMQEILSKLKPPYEDEELIQAQQKVGQYIFEKLEQKSNVILDPQKLNQMKLELSELMQLDLKNRLEINRDQTTSVSNQLLGKFFNSYQIPVLQNVDGIKQSLISEKYQEYGRFYKYYVENAKGSNKYRHIAEKVPSFLFDFFDKLIQQIQKVYNEENNQTKKFLVQAREGEERLRKTITNYENLLYEVQKEKDGILYETDNIKRELSKVDKLKKIEIETLQQKVLQLQLDLDSKKEKNSQLKADNQSLQDQLQRTRNDLNSKRVECAQLLKRVSEDNGRDNTNNEDITNELVITYKDMKNQAKQMDEFFRKRALDSSQQNIFIQEIQRLQQDKFNEMQKLREDYKNKKQKFRQELDKEKQDYLNMIRAQMKQTIDHLLEQNDALKAKNVTFQEKLEGSQKQLQSLKGLQNEFNRTKQQLEEKCHALDMHIQVIDNFTKDIEKLTGIREDLEQKIAFMNSEKSILISYKESFPYILRVGHEQKFKDKACSQFDW
ncbi:hypothetical protein pb186bvf_003674 [Paramecium bursaria]